MYSIKIGNKTSRFDVLPHLVAAQEAGKTRGFGVRSILGDLLLPTRIYGQPDNSDLNAFERAGWTIGAPAHQWVREGADRGERYDSVDVRQVLVDEFGRHYIDSGAVVLTLRADSIENAIDIADQYGLTVTRELRTSTSDAIRDGCKCLLARTHTSEPTLATVARLQDNPRFISVEPDLVEHMGVRWVPPDPGYPLQWHWKNDGASGGLAGADVDAQSAWAVTRGSGARIAVIDIGFDLQHPALSEAIEWGGHFAQTAEEVQFLRLEVGRSAFPIARHGTACAGMAIARSGRGAGCGLANLSGFIPIACLRDQVGTQSTLAEALVYAALPERTGLANLGQGADVISCSLGPNGSQWKMNSVLRDAIAAVTSDGRGGRGTVLVWAVSNADVPVNEDEVVSDARVVAVGRSNRLDRHDRSAWGDGLDMLAPGVSVLTTGEGGWTYETGCSFAAPVVAGVAAMVIATNPTWTREQVVQRLIQSCRKVGGGYDPLTGKSPRYGHGRIDAGLAVAAMTRGSR